MPDWGGGTLTVSGGGFGPGERVTVVAKVGQTQQAFQVTADARGRFVLRTGMRMGAGTRVSLEARGDQGTAMAAITTVPSLPMEGFDGDTAGQPPYTWPALLGGLAALILLAVWGWWMVRRRLQLRS
jgi:hypothetical protein